MKRLFICNASIIDGSGGEAFVGNVLIEGGRIAAVGAVGPVEGCETIDGFGYCLTPGFIDIHRHADLQVFSSAFGAAEISQGITTCISGNCGMSAAPCRAGGEAGLYGYLEPCLGKSPVQSGFPAFADYTRRLAGGKLPLNMGVLAGNGTVRIAVKGFDPAPLTAAELGRAKSSIDEAMEAGAMGLSMGLMYSPECNYTGAELVELARVAGRRGGVLVTHIRGEGGSLISSVAEVISIAGQAEVPLHISHFKAAGRSNWGATLNRAIELIEGARAGGQDVTCDVYPYAAGATMLLTVLPPALLAGGVASALAELKSPATRQRLKDELAQPHGDWDNLVLDLGWDRVVVSSASHEENSRFIGRSIAEIALAEGRDEVDCVCDILASEEGKAGMVMHSMSEVDVEQVLRLPWSMVISDSIYPPAGAPHPRLYGAFPRVIREAVLQKGVLTLPQAVRKMTALPAQRMGLGGRGLIQAGYMADLLLFRPEELLDTATYTNPVQLAKGIQAMLIGGDFAIRDGAVQPNKFGKFIERQANK